MTSEHKALVERLNIDEEYLRSRTAATLHTIANDVSDAATAIESLSAQSARPQAGVEATFRAGFSAGEAAGKFGDDTESDAWSRYSANLATPQPANPAQVAERAILALKLRQIPTTNIGDAAVIGEAADALAAIGAGGQAVASESLTGQPYNPDDERFAKLLDSQWRAGRTAGWNECFAQYVSHEEL